MTGASAELLSRLLDPRAATVVGASPNGYLTEHLLRNFRNHSCRWAGPVNLVNPGYRRLFEIETVPSVADVEGELGVLYLLVGLGAALPVLESLPRMPQSVVLFAEGSDPALGDRPEDAIAGWGRTHGVPVLGPQSNGLAVPGADYLGLVVPIVDDLRPGGVALLSQSGGILGGMIKHLSQRGVGIHSALEFGTACMLTMEELGLALLERDDVRLVAMYADSVGSIADFAAMLARAEQLEKSVVFMIGGRSDAGSRAAASHSGMATTPRAILAGLAAQHGALQVGTLDELVWSVEAIDQVGHRRHDGRALALLSDSGGANVAMSDALAAAGIELPGAQPATLQELGVEADDPVNPVDFGSQSMGHNDSVNRVIAAIAADPGYGRLAFASILGLPRAEQSVHLGQISDFAAEVVAAGKTPFIASLFPFLPTETVIDGAVVGMGSIESAAKLRALASLARTEATGAGEAEQPEGPGIAQSRSADDSGAPAVTGPEAEALLAGLPLEWPRSITVEGPASLAGAELPPYPVVVKSEAGLLHRVKVGGVLHGISDDDVLITGVRYLAERFNGPVSVTETVAHDAEFFVGAYRTGGLTALLFGPGGGRAEEGADLLVLPASPLHLERLARTHAGSGWEQFAALLGALQEWLEQHPEIGSVDLNPVVLSAGRLVALDAKVQHEAAP